MNNMKSVSSVRIHLDTTDEPSRRSSFDLNTISSILSRTKNRLNTNVTSRSSSSLDGQRTARLSSVSSSYAQFLKQRDIDKTKKTLSQEDHRLLLSSSEWVEDIKDSDPYVSVISRLSEAIQDSETYMEFVKKSVTIVTNTSVKYLNDCPVQSNLPVYLLVVGSMGLVRVLNLLWKQFRRRRMRKLEGVELDQEEETENNGSDFTDAVLNLFLLAWFIVGQYWTWRVFMPNFEFGIENPNNYCHRNVYIFTLIHIGFVYVMFLAAIFFLIALACCARFPHLIIKTPR
ncbi:unnamed protein product [Rotaria sp. Silwood1]|nr:unnamed protein product [Rotaria sp. Silwood1]CAF0967760.1 unnamed protein product [Rotaria sp. Silwood1]CAF0977056.1 unnamed protein product [Rotaria sp. Silwood1]CAF3392423.1 unnamed protein product [Rotaria sp. Silwood1]CAF3409253.1 unnamed protein product [Rotaria sp. Silwood1]